MNSPEERLTKSQQLKIIDRVVDITRRIDPKFDEFYQRKYSNLTGYDLMGMKRWAGNILGCFLANDGQTVDEKYKKFMESAKEMDGNISSGISNLEVAMGIRGLNFPLFAVEKDFLKELLSMEPSHDWNIDHEAALPYNFYALLLPQGVLTQGESEVTMLTMGVLETSDNKRVLFVNVHLKDLQTILHSRNYVKPNGEVEFATDIENFAPTSRDTAETIRKDLDLIKESTYLAMAITSAINSDFGIVQRGREPDRNQKKKKKTESKFWFAPVISAKKLHKGSSPKGTGHSGKELREHFRRAHWHTVLYGPGKTLRKKVRFPVTLVGNKDLRKNGSLRKQRAHHVEMATTPPMLAPTPGV
jgi:hypothetical protein